MRKDALPPGVLWRLGTSLAPVAAGLALLACAALADHAWLQRHFLPEFFQPRTEQRRALDIIRLLGAGLGVALISVLREPAARMLRRQRPLRLLADVGLLALAAALALGFSEALLQHLPWFATHELPTQREPLRRRDPYLGWSYVPDRTAVGSLGGRPIQYAFDAEGHRVRDQRHPVDYRAPSIVFAGESIMAGHGLAYGETIPAEVEAMTGLTAANLAVGGYATDQAVLRLRREWPRFERPAAVVILFMPALFHRNLDRDRPHLARGLVWRPPDDDWRLVQIVRRLVPYRSDREIEDGIAATQEQLRAVVDMACARGAAPLVVVPQYAPESAEEQALRRRILDAAKLPYVLVPLDPSWRVPGNRHPDARGSRALASAIASRLMAQGVGPVDRHAGSARASAGGGACPAPNRRASQAGPRRELILAGFMIPASNAPVSQPALPDIPPGRYVLDPRQSDVAVKAAIAGGLSAARVRFTAMEGVFSYEPATWARTKVTISVDARSASGPGMVRRATLASLDAFRHPRVTFLSSRIDPSHEDGAVEVAGELTLRGVTRPMMVHARLAAPDAGDSGAERPRLRFQGEGRIRRSDFGLPSPAPLTRDTVLLKFDVEFVRE